MRLHSRLFISVTEFTLFVDSIQNNVDSFQLIRIYKNYDIKRANQLKMEWLIAIIDWKSRLMRIKKVIVLICVDDDSTQSVLNFIPFFKYQVINETNWFFTETARAVSDSRMKCWFEPEIPFTTYYWHQLRILRIRNIIIKKCMLKGTDQVVN